MRPEDQTYPEVCICCGQPVPEGRMVCYACETGGGTVAPSKPERPVKDIRKTLCRKKEKRNEPRD